MNTYHALTTKTGQYYASDPGTSATWSDEHQAYIITVRGVRVYVPDPDALFDAPLPPVDRATEYR